MPLRPEDRPGQPGLLGRAARFTAATARWLGAGAPLRSQQGRLAALETCAACEKNQDGWCSECGCWIKLKTAYATESCPLGKWGAEKREGRGCGGCG